MNPRTSLIRKVQQDPTVPDVTALCLDCSDRSYKRPRTSIGFERHGQHDWTAACVAVGRKGPKWMPRGFMIQMNNYSISTEDTPNPHSVKFHVGSASIPEEAVNEEFEDGRYD